MTAGIRMALPADVLALEAIENSADSLLIDWLHPAHWHPAPTGMARLAMPGFILVASGNIHGAAVGFVHVIEIDGIAHLEQLSVLPNHGRRGLGRALVDAAKSEAAKRGHRWMTLRTFADVPWNAPFYRTCGFVETTPETGFHEELVDVEASLGLDRLGRRIQMTAPV